MYLNLGENVCRGRVGIGVMKMVYLCLKMASWLIA